MLIISFIQDCLKQYRLKQYLGNFFIWFSPKGNDTLNPPIVHMQFQRRLGIRLLFSQIDAVMSVIAVYWLGTTHANICAALKV
jgi:hypothetical protein